MLLGKVVGTVVATRKEPTLDGSSAYTAFSRVTVTKLCCAVKGTCRIDLPPRVRFVIGYGC